jgi:hypothetical protein
LSLIYDLVDGAFRVFMWMLLDPVGRTVFYALDFLCIVASAAYLIWDHRSENGLEKTRRPSNAGAQWKGAEGENKGAP